MPRARLALAFFSLLAAAPGFAAPCAQFTDVDTADSYCPSVEWLRNRSITTGCTTTAYCPAALVTRAQMALFMNRLGTALTPQVAFREDTPSAPPLDGATVQCQTAIVAAVPHPRQALVAVAFGGVANAPVDYSARPVVRLGVGAWQPIGSVAVPESVAAAAWGNTSVSGTVAIPANQDVTFGLRLAREGGAGNFGLARCQVHASVLNANGATSPFDVAAAP